jgi:hypothetical protein
MTFSEPKGSRIPLMGEIRSSSLDFPARRNLKRPEVVRMSSMLAHSGFYKTGPDEQPQMRSTACDRRIGTTTIVNASISSTNVGFAVTGLRHVSEYSSKLEPRLQVHFLRDRSSSRFFYEQLSVNYFTGVF